MVPYLHSQVLLRILKLYEKAKGEKFNEIVDMIAIWNAQVWQTRDGSFKYVNIV